MEFIAAWIADTFILFLMFLDRPTRDIRHANNDTMAMASGRLFECGLWLAASSRYDPVNKEHMVDMPCAYDSVVIDGY